MKNIKEITDIFKKEIKKKYTSQITMPIYMGVSDMEIILEEIERLNNIINELEKWLEDYHNNTGLGNYETGIDDGICDTLKKLQELKGSDKE